MNKQQFITSFNLKKHIEGGYFAEIYQSPLFIEANDKSQRRTAMSTIYYMLTNDEPIGHFHQNKSDILHFFHAGSPITYFLINSQGCLEKRTLGLNISEGQQPQLLVKGGIWKASLLPQGEFGLLSEAVSPGFDYGDMMIAKADHFKVLFPHLWREIARFVKPSLPTL